MGPVLEDGTNDIAVFIDDLVNPIASFNSTTTVGYNAVQLMNSAKANGETGQWSQGAFDNVEVVVPTAVDPPVAAPAVPGWTIGTGHQIAWNWTETAAVDSFRIYNQAAGGAVLSSGLTGASRSFAETGLPSNTQVSRWLTAYSAGYETPRVALPPTYSLADPPMLDINVFTWANNYDYYYIDNPWPGFTNPEAFGINGHVSKFKYKWSNNALDTIADGEGTDWSSDPMMAPPPTDGEYYLYLRSYNADGASNPNWLSVGPFDFGDPGKLHRILLQGCNTDAGTPTGPGLAAYQDVVTIHANTKPGYKFLAWVTDGCGGYNVASHSADYTFSMPAYDEQFSANYDVTSQTLTVTTCGGGTGAITDPAPGGSTGSYPTATSVTVAATPDSAHAFKNWTTDICGGTAVASTENPYTFPMTTADLTLYANFDTLPQFTLTSVPAAGGTLTGSGYYAGGTAVAVDATSNANFYFVGWSTSADQTGLITRSHSYTYTTPATGNKTLYAIFAVGKFYEGFEGLKTGRLPMNDSGLDHTPTAVNNYFATGNGDKNTGNPWLGYFPVNSYLVTSPQLSGSLAANAQSCFDAFQAANIAFRCNGGSNLVGGFYLDWYFYDPVGTASGSNLYRDFIGIALYPSVTLPAGKDYGPSDYTTLQGTAPNQYLQGGCGSIAGWTNAIELGTGTPTGTPTFYEYRVCTGLKSGTWTATTRPRSIGWHHGRIAVGTQKGDLTNDVSVYVDDMLNPCAPTIASTSTAGFNAVQLNQSANTGGGTPTSGYFDNIEVITPGTQSIDKWSVIGHYANAGNNDDATRINTDFFAPSGTTEANIYASTGKTYNGKTWALCNGGIVDFNKLYGTMSNGASYLFTYIVNSGSAITDAQLTCGSDDGLKVFLNGSAKATHAQGRSFSEDQDLVGSLTINPGVNRLMVKISQGGGDYRGQARLVHADGTPLAGVTFVPSDDAAPTGSISINNGPADGDAGTTDNPNVTLHFAASDDLTGVATMSISYDGGTTWGSAEPVVTSKSYTLTDGDGLKTICVKYKDVAGNESSPHCATIALSTVPPCAPPTGATSVMKISDIWALANGSNLYELSAKSVTAVWTDGFWIEEANRSAGIKVLYPSGACTIGSAVTAGASVDVYGTFSTGDMRLMTASVVVNNGDGAFVKPVEVTEKYSGGKGPTSNTPAVIGGKGIYGVGLLAKIAGSS